MAGLTETQIKAKSLGTGMHHDGGGLYLRRKTDDGPRSWVLRYTLNGKRCMAGLGGYPDVSLADARERATDMRRLAKRGIDPTSPIVAAPEVSDINPHFGPLLDAFFNGTQIANGYGEDLKNDKARQSWLSPLAVHVVPALGAVDVRTIQQHTLAAVLQPIWKTHPVTARKCLTRTLMVMRFAKNCGLEVPNLTELRDDVRGLLQKQAKGGHRPSMPYEDIPIFWGELLEANTTSALALRLLILTGSRAGPVRHATIDQFDLAARVWTIPAEAMKGQKGMTADFRVALSDAACDVVSEAVRLGTRNSLLFWGTRHRPISDATMGKFMRSRGYEFVPHGFRASLRTWMAEQTDTPRDVAKAVLAQFEGNKVDKAYQRSDLLERRRMIMDQWAAHVTGKAFDPVEAERAALERRLAELGAA